MRLEIVFLYFNSNLRNYCLNWINENWYSDSLGEYVFLIFSKLFPVAIKITSSVRVEYLYADLS